MTADDFLAHVHALNLEDESHADAATLFSEYGFQRTLLDQAFRSYQNWVTNYAAHTYHSVEIEETAVPAANDARWTSVETEWQQGIRRLEDEYFAGLANELPTRKDHVQRLAQARLRAWAMPHSIVFKHYDIAAGADFDLIATLQRRNIDIAEGSPAAEIVAEHARSQDALLRDHDQERQTRGERLRPFNQAIRDNLDAIRASGLESRHPLIEAYSTGCLPTYRWPRELRTLNLRTMSLLKGALDAESFHRLQLEADRALHPYVFDSASVVSMLAKALSRNDLTPQQRIDLNALYAALSTDLDDAKARLGELYDRVMRDESLLERHRTNALVYLYMDQAPPEKRPGKPEFESAVEAWKAKAAAYRQQVLDALSPAQREEAQR